MSDAPPFLLTMRAITGVKEAPGETDNPQILAMADLIAQRYPEMTDYCAQYNHDSIAWCGLTVAFTLAMNGIRPPFGETDTDKFLWAQSFADDPGFERLSSPILGCIVVLTREGGGHVTLYENSSNGSYNCRGGNQSDAINVAPQSKSNVIALLWPIGIEMPMRELQQGDTGPDVAEVQRILALPVDGDFGPLTDAQVRSFQAAAYLGDVDGVVGEDTWNELDALDLRVREGDDGLPLPVMSDIMTIANESPLMTYSWRDRGVAPAGYIQGMAMAFGLAARWQLDGVGLATAMGAADSGKPDYDVLSWYKREMAAKGWSNARPGLATLRHLFALMIGLGMRESSGRYCEGRDMSASNVEADTAEAGLFQTSWNIASADPNIPPLLDAYWASPNGFIEAFQNGVTPNANDMSSYGTGAGARYQFLARYSPAFAAFVTALGLRKRRQHWGPVNRKEIELLDDADEMLKEVQALIEQGEIDPAPEPEPEPEQAEVNIMISASGPVKVTINGQTVVEPA